MDLILHTIGFAAYLLVGRLAMRLLRGNPREAAFTLLNLSGVFFLLFYGQSQNYRSRFVLYLLIVLIQYLVFSWLAESKRRWSWLAFFTPLLFLAAFRYIPNTWYVALGAALGKKWPSAPDMIGFSYLAFRCSRLVVEVRNGSVAKPGLWQYFGFAFFLPTMSVGPINTYANFRQGFQSTPWEVPVGRAALRIMVGLVKYEFLGPVFSQLTYSAFLLNGRPHYWEDLPIAMVFYYLFLYCNFSGFCDLAIGGAALMGIPVLENFHNPFAARNIKEFWNRWHITLSQWMRDLVFAPLSEFLMGVLGISRANHAIALAITIVFLLVGIWHGVGWHFALYGAVHALGLVANHYYTLFLKKRLGREGFKAYMANPWIHAAAVALTFAYCGASLIFFANTLPQIREIFQSLR